jgi:hypothetical protein
MIQGRGRAWSWASLCALYLLLAGLIAWRFAPFMSRVFFGDDLNHLLQFMDGQCATRLAGVLTSSCAEKFRPVFAAFTIVTFGLFKTVLWRYMAVNVLLHAASATLVFLLALRLGTGRAGAFAIALAFALSRFATYQLTQADGPVEGLALLFALAALYAVMHARGDGGSAWRDGWLALAAALLALYSHERYIALAPALFLFFLMLPAYRPMPRGRRTILLAACAAMPALVAAYKVGVLHSSLLVGTAGTHIELDPERVLEHFHEGVASMFGLNDGPEYLVGARLASLPWFPAWICAGLILGTWVASAAGSAWTAARAGPAGMRAQLGVALPLLATAALLLAPALTTIRLEQRWLLAPFTLLLLVLAWAAGVAGRRAPPLRWLPAVVLAGASVLLDALVMRHFDALYLVSSAKVAQAVKRDVLDRGYDPASGLVFIANRSVCTWVLLGGGFFRVYGTGTQPVRCVDTAADLPLDAVPPGARVFAIVAPMRVVDATADWRAVAARAQGRTTFDFLDHVAQGRINSEAVVSTPTGRGVFTGQWGSLVGARDVMIVISGFSYRFEGLRIGPDTWLEFGVGMPYPTAEPARAVVKVSLAGEDAGQVIYSRDLAPPNDVSSASFAYEAIPLAQFAGRTVALTFATQTPGSDSRGHWIAYAQPRLVERDPR